MGLTIDDIHKKMYMQFRALGMSDDEIFARHPRLKRAAEMSDFEAHFGYWSWKQVVMITLLTIAMSIFIWWMEH